MFKGIQIQNEPQYNARVTEIAEEQLGNGEVEVNIEYSTLNYKDALAITGKGKIIREFPMTPGIDFAGKVFRSQSDDFVSGDSVILNGFGVGERFPGGLAQKARVPADFLIKQPSEFSSKEAMMLGTAGYTAMLCVLALQKQGVTPDKGEILVTGGNGGVGSVAIMLLSKLGYQVIASTGRPEEKAFLQSLGAVDIIERSELSEPGRPMVRERWAGVIDSVGSHTLANACAATQYGGTVAACGLAQGMDLNMTVAPFILRGVKLIGIDSVMRPIEDRKEAWKALGSLVDKQLLASLSTVVALSSSVDLAEQLLAGKVRGRLVVDVNT
ncbi:MDR family oxidoreductase [Glaciecola sp. KUL10]|uniref:acrylyl-CoA reductase (NADPH) n=1 Tax=Glaciecola sp. (strain KUL10) TaxID=2161813 RepID=UPI000D78BB88|nr:MDR family oxidoreductase [Glaciecola sp. KUL10]GBL06053.1 alcohol dehydrogenase [Glaciecola sp. KUL10]